MKPMEIEKRSFEIIAEELRQKYPGKQLDPAEDLVVRRVIHTTADFEYFETLSFSENAVEKMKQAIEEGCDIVTDTTMALSGINKKTLAKFGGSVHCFIGDEDVAAEAKERGVTRSLVSMEKAARMEKPLIFAIGNAPTALQSICSLFREGKLNPRMVVGVPVGFVNVVEAKEELMATVPDYIVARGRKGGSNVAASIVNAVLYQLVTREGM
ncbi:MAG: precorrin-8X methylmutase [Firmicutes bacterium]|nr:precorrin-8X methylmutase [Bacillota bacterium]